MGALPLLLPLGVATITILIFSATIVHYLCISMPLAIIKRWAWDILNVCNNLNVCCAHEGETVTDESAEVLSWKN